MPCRANLVAECRLGSRAAPTPLRWASDGSLSLPAVHHRGDQRNPGETAVDVGTRIARPISARLKIPGSCVWCACVGVSVAHFASDILILVPDQRVWYGDWCAPWFTQAQVPTIHPKARLFGEPQTRRHTLRPSSPLISSNGRHQAVDERAACSYASTARAVPRAH